MLYEPVLFSVSKEERQNTFYLKNERTIKKGKVKALKVLKSGFVE